jgi:hypothetical protein
VLTPSEKRGKQRKFLFFSLLGSFDLTMRFNATWWHHFTAAHPWDYWGICSENEILIITDVGQPKMHLI